MRLIMTVWGWLVSLLEFFRRGSLWMALASVVIVAGCTSSESAFSGSPHGYSGRINTWMTDMNVVPTIMQKGERALQSDYGSEGKMRDMPSTYEVDRAGNMRATGVAAYVEALSNLCRIAPESRMCK